MRQLRQFREQGTWVGTIVQANTDNWIAFDFLKPEAVAIDQGLAYPLGPEATAAEFLDSEDGRIFRSAVGRRFPGPWRALGRAAERRYSQDRGKRRVADLS